MRVAKFFRALDVGKVYRGVDNAVKPAYVRNHYRRIDFAFTRKFYSLSHIVGIAARSSGYSVEGVVNVVEIELG